MTDAAIPQTTGAPCPAGCARCSGWQRHQTMTVNGGGRWYYFSPALNGGSLPGGVVSSAIASIMATMT
jgi:hypothetical protein